MFEAYPYYYLGGMEMRNKWKFTKTVLLLIICIVITLLGMTPRLEVYAINERCGMLGCDGEYDNGFCLKCGCYQKPKQVSNTHYSELMSTHKGYYAIENAGNLYWIAEYINDGGDSVDVVLVSDIVDNKKVLDASGQLNASDEDGFRIWITVGENRDPYKGTFDGNNHIISGLYYSGDRSCVGVFGAIDGAVVKNLGVVDSYLCGNDALIGGIAGGCYQSDVLNCFNSGVLIGVGKSSQVGGIVGYSQAEISNSYNN